MQLRIDGGSEEDRRAGTQMQKPRGFVCMSREK